MNHTRVKELTSGSPMKLILGFTTPLLFGFLFQQLYSFVDTAIVGRYLGSESLAAVGDTGSINFLVLGFCQGFCAGFSIPVAQAFGAGDYKLLRQTVANSVYLAGFISVLMAIFSALFCPTMLRLMDTPPQILPQSVAYIRIVFLGIPATILYNLSSGILRALGDSKTPVIFLVLASLVNIVLDLVLILYARMGVAGAAVATVLSQIVSGIGCVVIMKKRFPILHLSAQDRILRMPLVCSLAGIGLPMGLQYAITAVGSVMVQWSVNSLGVIPVAAVAAGSKISVFFCCIFDALATTMATYAGQNMGARKLNRISQGVKCASLIGIIYCLLALAAIFLLDSRLLSLFVNPQKDPEVMKLACHYLRLNGLFYIPLLFVNILRLTIQGMGFTRIAMLAGVFEMIARMLVALLLVPSLAFNGACLANPAAWVLADCFLFPCYFHVMHMVYERFHEPRATV